MHAQVPEYADVQLPQNTVPVLIEDGGLDQDVVDQYITSLRAAFKAGAPEADIKAAFAGEALTEDKAGPVDNSKDKAELLAFKTETIPAVDLNFDDAVGTPAAPHFCVRCGLYAGPHPCSSSSRAQRSWRQPGASV
jgi:hypothetical protein